MIVLDLSILNQKGTPMFNSDLTANRPAAGIVGRIFIAIDAPYGIFRDTGTAWDQVAGAGGGTNIYNADGTLTGNRVVSSGGFNLSFNPQTTFSSSLTASTGASSYAVLGSNTLSYAVGFSSSNIGNVYGANGAINLQNFLGDATFAQANLASANVSVNSIDFGSGGHTITMTQSTGIRAMTGHQSQIQFQGSHNGTISHAAVSQNLGFYRAVGSTRTLTITNAYSLLLNALDDYGAGFTFTNRWGIYQAGASDPNFFAGVSTFGNNLSVSKNFAGNTNLTVSNTSTSGSAFPVFSVTSATGQFQMFKGNNSSGIFAFLGGPDAGIYNNISGNFGFVNNPSGKFIWGNDATTIPYMTLFSTGNLAIGSTTDSGNRLRLSGSLRVDGQTTATVGVISGQYLTINCDGTLYKIILYNV